MSNSVQTIQGAGGKVIGYIQHLSGQDYQVLDERQRLVGRCVQGRTYDKNGRMVSTSVVPAILLGMK